MNAEQLLAQFVSWGWQADETSLANLHASDKLANFGMAILAKEIIALKARIVLLEKKVKI